MSRMPKNDRYFLGCQPAKFDIKVFEDRLRSRASRISMPTAAAPKSSLATSVGRYVRSAIARIVDSVTTGPKLISRARRAGRRRLRRMQAALRQNRMRRERRRAQRLDAKTVAASASAPVFAMARPDFRMLEPRIVFDAAGVATAAEAVEAEPLPEAEVATDAAAETEATNASQVLQDAIAQSPGAETTNEIIFIDANVADPNAIIREAELVGEVIMLDANRDGVEQIAEVLEGRSGIDAVHIISHGDEGELRLGNAVLNAASMAGEHADELAVLGAALSDEADVLIYGCDFGSGAQGASAVETFRELTGADIAASDDDTGRVELGGDWELEVEAGAVETAAIEAVDWQGTLAPPTIDLDNISDQAPVPGENGFTELTFRAIDPVTGDILAITGNDGQTEELDGAGNGEFARLANVGTIDGQSIDMIAEVVRYVSDDDGIQGIAALDGTPAEPEDPLFGVAGPPGDQDNANVNLGNNRSGPDNRLAVEVRWTALISGTDTPIIGNFAVVLSDMDARFGDSTSYEEIIVDTSSLDSFVLGEDPNDPSSSGLGSDIRVLDAAGNVIYTPDQDPASFVVPDGYIRFNPLDSDPDTPGVRQDNSVQLNFTNTSSFNVIYNRQAAGANLALDGNFEGAFFTDAVSVDTNPDFANIFTEGQAPVTIAADTIQISDDGQISGATITLTNPQTADQINVPGSLPTGITVQSSSANEIILTGDASADSYETAIRAITFENTSTDPDETTVREIEISVMDDEALTSNLASSFIQVIAVEGAPVPAIDTDGDGVADVDDIDDDNDGILDVNEGFSETPINFLQNESFEINNGVTGGIGSGVFNGNVASWDLVWGTADFYDGSTDINEIIGGGVQTFNAPDGQYYAGFHSGDGSAGNIFNPETSLSNSAGNREVIIQTLQNPLQAGVTYTLEMDVANYDWGIGPGQDLSTGIEFYTIDAGSDGDADGDGIGNYNDRDFVDATSLYADGNVIGALATGNPGINFEGRITGIGDAANGFSTVSITFTPTNDIDRILLTPDSGRLQYMLVDNLRLVGTQTTVTTRDSDNDGIADHLDIDSDNDGITDNIEAQATDAYIAPSGVGGTPGFTDIDGDGLDDVYDQDTVVATTTAARSAGLTPVNSDGQDNPDYLDTDSDNEGGNDTDEAGLTGTATGLSTAANDADGDGLFDVFDAQNGTTTNDGFVVNEGLSAGARAYPDADGDATGATTPLTADVDFRDATDSTDTDGDGVADVADVDDDNDGILDVVEDNIVSAASQSAIDFTSAGTTAFPATGTDTAVGTLDINGTAVDVTVDAVFYNGSTTIRDNTFTAGLASATSLPTTEVLTATPDVGFADIVIDFNGDALIDPVIHLFADGSSNVFDIGHPFTIVAGVGTQVGTTIQVDAVNASPDGVAVQLSGVFESLTLTDQTPNSSDIFFQVTAQQAVIGGRDADNDGIINSLDIDSDNDGITDNIEAQATDAYVAPSGIGSGITDLNADGLDDNYDTRAVTISTAAATVADARIVPVNSDAGAATPDATPDYLDTDSDNDGIDDTAEAGLTGAPISGVASTNANDADRDGLFDVFDAQNGTATNDGYVVNEGLSTGARAYPDADGDAIGATTPLTADVDFRDVPSPNTAPIVDLNGPNLPGEDFADIFVEDTPGQPLSNLLSFDAIVQDADDNIARVDIAVTLPQPNDGADEFLRIDSGNLQLSVNLGTGVVSAPNGLTFGGTTFAVTYNAGVISIENATGSGDPIDSDDLQGFMRLLAYENRSQNNTDGARVFEFQVIDPFSQTVADSTITVERANDAPIPVVLDSNDAGFTGEIAEIGSGTEPVPFAIVAPTDGPAEIAVADLLAQLAITDVEQSEFGIGIIYADESEGVWQYTRTDIPDHEWTDFQVGDADNDDPQPVPDGEALLMDPDAVLRFIPDAGYSGGAEIHFRVWDGTVGTASNPPSTIIDDSGGVAPTNTSSLSTAAFIASLAADTDGDGIINADDIDDDNDGILDTVERVGSDNVETTIYLNDNNNNLIRVDDVNGTPVTTTVGDLGRVLGDIGMAPDGTLYGVDFSTNEIVVIDVDTASTTVVGTLPPAIVAPNSLSFDSDGRGYVGAGDFNTNSNVYSFDPANPSNATVWHNFGTGRPAGDFIFFNDRAYIAWSDTATGNDVLREVGLDASGAVTSDTILGTLPASTFGIAADAFGVIYAVGDAGVGQHGLYQLDVPTAPLAGGTGAIPATVVPGTTLASGQYFGATSSSEALLGTDRDTDNDGILDHLDIDADDDGITDNVEAQATDSYIAPSGTGSGITDVNQDGLDDVYDARNGTLTPTSSAANGADTLIVPVDTDGLGSADYIDPDSDNDGILDVAERGDGRSVTYIAGDADGDGLADVFEGADANDGYDVNDENVTTAAGASVADKSEYNLSSDPDLAADLSNVNGVFTNLTFRDQLDTDGDGVADIRDVDKDNDGILDTVEGFIPEVKSGVDFTGVITQGTAEVATGSAARVGVTITFDQDSGGAGLDVRTSTRTAIFDSAEYAIENATGTVEPLQVRRTDNVIPAGGNPITIDFGEPVNEVLIHYASLDLTALEFLAADNPGLTIEVISSTRTEVREDSTRLTVGDTDPAAGDNNTGDEDADDGNGIDNGVGQSADGTIRVSGSGFTQINLNLILTPIYQDDPNLINQPADRLFLGLEICEPVLAVDTDGDGIADHLDIDSDNDGITDNIEAQTTDGYTPPSGVGGTPGFTDINGDGLDDTYDTRGGALNAGSAAATVGDGDGLTPVNSDAAGTAGVTYTADTTPDYLDTDSDGDGIDDAAEAGHGQALIPNGTLSDNTNDADGDGLFDVFETAIDGNANDGFVVNEGVTDVLNAANGYLPDAGGDASVGTATPLVNDLDFRDLNDAPVAEDDGPIAVTGGTPSIINIVGGGNGAVADTDPDGDTLSVTEIIDPDGTVTPITTAGQSVTLSTGVTVVANGDGTVTATTPLTFTGTTTFDYRVADPTGESDTATVTLDSTSGNTPPVAVDDALAGDEATVTTNDLTPGTVGQDSDADNHTITVTRVATGSTEADLAPLADGTGIGTPVAGSDGGTFTVQPDGTVAFDPNGEFEDLAVGESRITQIVYQIDDGNGGTDTAVVTYTVGGLNDPVTPEDPDNPGVPPGDPNDYIPDQTGEDGTPVTDFDLTPYFTDTDTNDVIELSIDPADLPPGLTFDPLTNTISGTPDANASQLGPNGDGVYPITVTATDNNGSTITTTLDYTITNPAPIAENDAIGGDEDTVVNSDLLADNGAGNPDRDPDGDTFTVTRVAAGSDVSALAGLTDGTGVSATVAGSNGELFTVQPDGSVEFDPNGEFEDLAAGATETTQIVYQIDDGQGGTDTAVVTYTVTGVNDAPKVQDPIAPGVEDPTFELPDLTNDDSDPITGGTAVDLSQYFFDVDTGDTLTFTVTGLPDGLSVNPTTGEVTGTIAADASQGGPNSDGVWPVTVEVSDGTDTTTVTFDWTVNNLPPVAENDALTGDEDTVVNADLFADNGSGADTDPDGDTINVTRVAAGSDVSALAGLTDGTGVTTAVTGSNGGTFTVQPDGSVEFDPGDDFNGLGVGETATTEIVYQIDDGEGGTDTAVVTYTVTGVNDAPIPVDPTQPPIDLNNPPPNTPFDPDTPVSPPADPNNYIPPQTGADTTPVTDFVLTPYFGDPDAPDVVTLSIPNGELPPGLTFNPVNNTISGTPDANASQGGDDPVNAPGVYVIPVTATDPHGATFTTNVTYTITNPPPVAIDDALTGDEDTVVNGSLFVDNDGDPLANGAVDNDPDGDAFTVTRVAAGNVEGDLAGLTDGTGVGAPVAGSNGGTFTVQPDGSVSFDPGDDFNGLGVGETATTEIVYQIDDGEGGVDQAVVTYTVTGVNDAPIPVDPTQPPIDVNNPPPNTPFDPDTPFAPPADPNDYIPAQTGEDSTPITDFDLTPYFGDPDAPDAVTLSIPNGELPPGLTFDPLTGLISGTPTSDASQGGDDPLNAPGVYVIPVTATDPHGATFTTNVTYTITNPPPVAVDDPLTGDEDTIATNDLTPGGPSGQAGQDLDPDGDVITVTRALTGNTEADLATVTDGTGIGTPVAGTNGGTFTVQPDGTVTFDPGIDFQDLDVGEDRVTEIVYQIDDGQGGTDTAVVSYTVTGVNDAPVVINPNDPGDPKDPNTPPDPDNVIPDQTGEDSAPLTPLGISPFFTDVDVEPLTFGFDPADPDVPSWLSIDPVTGILTGTPDADASQLGPNFDGVYPITVTATDPDGEVVTTTVDFTITNPEPVAEDDLLTATEDAPITADVFVDNGSGVDTDPDGDVIVVSAVNGQPGGVGQPVTGSNGGTFTLQPDRTVVFDPAGQFEELAAGETVTTAVTYTISDGQGGTDTATVKVEVTGIDDAPIVGTPALDQTHEDGETIAPVDLSDGFNNPTGNPLTFTADGLPPGLTIDPVTGEVTGTIDPDASLGGPYPVVVTATDPITGETATVPVLWTVTNPDPVAEDDATSTPVDTPVTVSVIGNDSDPDGDDLTVSEVTTPPVNGTVTLNPDGTVTYTPDAGFTGTDKFTYQVSDGNGGTDTAEVTVTVGAPPVDAPTATPIAPQANDDAETITPVDVSGNFTDPNGDPLTFTANGLPPGLEIDPVTGVISGTIDPSASVAGPYDVTVTAVDPDGNTVSQTVPWAVANPAPTAIDDTTATPLDTPVTLSLVGNDTDPDDDDLSIHAINTDPSNGTLAINPDGTVTYTPNAGFTGTDTFTYLVTDGEGGFDEATVTVVVDDPAPGVPTATPAPPVSEPDGETITPIETAPSFNDPDGDPLTFTAVGLPDGLSIDPVTGEITGTLPPNASQGGPNDDGIYPIVVTATDPDGNQVTTTVPFTATNPAPVAEDDTASTTPNVPVIIGVTGNDADGGNDGDELTVTAIPTPPTNGTVVINPDGTVTYTPDAGFTGTDTFTYEVSDGQGGTDIATVTVDVTPTPITLTGVPVVPEQSGEDSSPVPPVDMSEVLRDPEGEPLTFTAVDLPPGLTIDPVTGIISGTPTSDASQGGDDPANNPGVYTTTVTATDPNGNATDVVVTYTITNPPPIAQDDALTGDEDTPTTDNVFLDNGSGIDLDPDGDTFSLTEVNGDPSLVGTPVRGTSGGTFTLQPNGDVAFDPAGDFEDLAVGETRTTEVAYTIDDGQGGTDTATVTYTVTGVNDAPVPGGPDRDGDGNPDGGDVAIITPEDTPIDGEVIAEDVDGDPLTYVTGTPPTNGTVTVNPDGTYTYTPGPDYNGPDQFTVTAKDPFGGEVEITVDVTVTPVQDAFDDTSSTQQDLPVTINPSLNDTFSGPVTIVDLEGSPGATLVANPDGTITYTPPSGFVGTDVITVTFETASGTIETSTITVTVTSIPVPLPEPAADEPPADDTAPPSLEVRGIVVDTVESVDDLGGMTGLGVSGIVVQAANGIDSLNGTVDASNVGDVVRHVTPIEPDRIREIGKTVRGLGWWAPDDISGFSLRFVELEGALDRDGGSVVVESLVRDRLLIIQVTNELDRDGAKTVESYTITGANGEPLPAWLDRAAADLLIGKRPLDAESLTIRIEVEYTDGSTESRRVVIQGETGEIQPVREQGASLNPPVPVFQAQLGTPQVPSAEQRASLAKALTD